MNKNRTVLLVEDEAIIAIEAEMSLRDMGWTVMGPFATVERASKALEDTRPDIAVLDFNLRSGTSEALAVTLLEQSMPVIFLSGDTRSTTIESLKTCHVVEKPASMDDLNALLCELLDIKR
ncbi:response regulator [Robiginitomaculum antarcticum]|uniref:response regulator n=1 Tax=Robiginitomaculum antarcticum TaxID=437507 RepID=UPI00036225CA|nr:response regulator [Robiginitomaculum antarcticum]